MYARLSPPGLKQVPYGCEGRIRMFHVLPYGQCYDSVECTQRVVVHLADIVYPQVQAVAQESIPVGVGTDVQPHDLAAVVSLQHGAQVAPSAPDFQYAHPSIEVEALVNLRDTSGRGRKVIGVVLLGRADLGKCGAAL